MKADEFREYQVASFQQLRRYASHIPSLILLLMRSVNWPTPYIAWKRRLRPLTIRTKPHTATPGRFS
jgi:hypothetical protein